LLFISTLAAAQPTVINHFAGDAPASGDEMHYVLKSTDAHSVVINYYVPAPANDEERLAELLNDATGFYIDRTVLFDGQAISLRDSEREVLRDLEHIVKDAVKYYHFRELKRFGGFSQEVASALAELNEAAIPANWSPEVQGTLHTDKRLLFVEQAVNALKRAVHQDIRRFCGENMLMQIKSEERELEAEQDSLLSAVRSFKKNDPLAPMEITFSNETLNLLAGNDDFTLPTFSENPQPTFEGDLADRILYLLETNSQRIDDLTLEVRELQAPRNENAELRAEIQELRTMLYELLSREGQPAALPPTTDGYAAPLPFDRFSIRYPVGGTHLDLNAQLQLSELINLLAHRDDMRIMVTGYADRTGNREANLRLSQQRANTVRDQLLAAGIAPHRVLVNYFGEEKATGSPDDRRVEISFL
jgi:outer membrane protein OmpA-like peptidoglycan-associated protein